MTAAGAWLLAVLGVASTTPSARPESPAISERVAHVLAEVPLIDGHNDLPYILEAEYPSERWTLDLEADGRTLRFPIQTDLTRLRAGRVGGQFWSVWVPPDVPGPQAVQRTLEGIDFVRGMVGRYPQHLEFAATAQDIRRIHRDGRIASLIGVEGGQQIGNSLGVLRQFHALGVRYLTLTHAASTDWADSATGSASHGGLSDFGRQVVCEMNRLGMLVDLSHASDDTMRDALAVTRAPVIFSHSSARALAGHPRNVPDDVLRLLAANGGIVMVNFYPGFLTEEYRAWAARGQADEDLPRPEVTLKHVADHIEHVREVAGLGHVGIGSDFDGMGDAPRGLEGVDRYPDLLAELMRRGWTDAEVASVAGGNILRVMEAAEAVSREQGRRAC